MIKAGKITGVEGTKHKDGEPQQWTVNISVDDLGFEKNELVLSYTHKTAYEPGFAEIIVKGKLFIEEKNSKEIAEAWQKKKILPNEFMEEVVTAISYTASTVGTLIAYALSISAPINVPRARLTPAQPGKAAS
jgi:hypothetical protein